MEQDFVGIFGSTLHVFFCPFLRSSSLNHAHSAMVLKDLFPIHESDDKVFLDR